MNIGEPASGGGFRVRDVFRHGAEPPPLQFIARQRHWPWFIVAITCIGAFVGQLDASIVQLVLPTLVDAFHAPLGRVSWVALAYPLAFAAFLPISGRLSEMYGRKLPYLCGYLLFAIASALCGFAGSLPTLVAFRLLQGIGGASLGANSITILVNAVGPARRARAMGIFAAAQAVGLSAGPAIGGVLVGVFGWRWVFWVTVPFGAVAFVLGWLTLPRTARVSADKTFDWAGALLLAPALVALIFALNHVSALGSTSPTLLTCAAAFIVLIALFVWRERSIAVPLVNLQLFAFPAFTRGVAGVVLSYALLYGMFFLISFALVRGYHVAEAVAGLRLASIPIAIGVAAPFSGALADWWGPRSPTVLGMAICIGVLLALSVMAPLERIGLVIGLGLLALFGVGIGLFIAPNNATTMGAAPTALSSQAGAMLNLMRSLGTSIGIATASSMLSWRMAAVSRAPSSIFGFDGRPLLAAVESSFAMLVLFALTAGIISLVRNPAISK
jgi:EmrB/QacA subfamily drug resistance transporter